MPPNNRDGHNDNKNTGLYNDQDDMPCLRAVNWLKPTSAGYLMKNDYVVTLCIVPCPYITLLLIIFCTDNENVVNGMLVLKFAAAQVCQIWVVPY